MIEVNKINSYMTRIITCKKFNRIKYLRKSVEKISNIKDINFDECKILDKNNEILIEQNHLCWINLQKYQVYILEI